MRTSPRIFKLKKRQVSSFLFLFFFNVCVCARCLFWPTVHFTTVLICNLYNFCFTHRELTEIDVTAIDRGYHLLISFISTIKGASSLY